MRFGRIATAVLAALAVGATPAHAHELTPSWGYAFIDDRPFNEPGPEGAALPAAQVNPRGAIRDTIRDGKDVRLTVEAFTAGSATPFTSYKVDEGDFEPVPNDQRLTGPAEITQVRYTFCRFNPSNGAIEVCEPAHTITRPPPPLPAPEPDRDGDGANAAVDCWDTNATVYPGAPEIAGNGVDDDCAGGDAPGRLNATVRNTWKAARGRVWVTQLRVVEAPPGARVEVRCSGRRCPFKRRSTTVNARGDAPLAKYFKKKLRPRITIEVRITQPNTIGRVTRFPITRVAVPPARRYCLPPGQAKPVRCQ